MQNVDNINNAVMNCKLIFLLLKFWFIFLCILAIHKAGKHMEDHIVAAHSAVIIGYVLLVDQVNLQKIKNFDNLVFLKLLVSFGND
jgi:hypothetical protein